ncbi:serine/threonine-protein kinase, partial [Acidobacteria bacterium AH-259-O06]|nr:serine/threonine-protein kinase [Acidobacteria bacterium AH-259-O06]
PEGHVKVMDFGLAKQLVPAEGIGSQEQTITASLTKTGAALGTLAYMSPEQLQGEETDTRSDIFSFGIVLYEMLTGTDPFKKDRPLNTASSILKDDPPPLSRYLDEVPSFLPHTVRKMLAKEPDRRYQLIHDVRVDLEELKEGSDSTLVSQLPDVKPAHGWTLGLVLALAVVSVGTVVTLWLTRSLEPPPESAPLRLEINVSGEEPLHTTWGNFAALSPDGKRLAFVTTEADRPQLQLRSLDRLESEMIQGTEGAHAPFFSPDGQWLGFFTGSDGNVELRKVSISGGTPSTLGRVDLGYLGRADEGRGATWGPGGTIVFAQSQRSLMRVSAAEGTPEELTRLQEGETGHSWPQFLPGGRHVLFISSTASDSRIEVVEVRTGQRKVIHRAGRYPRYAASGHLLYVDGSTLFAAPFDLQGLEMTAEPVPVLQDVMLDDYATGAAHYDVSANGTLVYLTGTASQSRYLVEWKDREGKTQPLLSVPNDYRYVRFSPHGRQLAVEIYDGIQIDIWVYEWERDTLSRLTFDPALDGLPIWSPDSRGFVFFSPRDGEGIYWRRSDGSGDAVRLTQSKIRQLPYSWHPSGKFLAFWKINPETGLDIGILPLEGDSQSGWKAGEPTDFLKTPFNEAAPAFSPDGKWLAYQSDESGRSEVYVRPFPGPGGKWPISNGGGFIAAWFSNTRELFYQKDDQFMVVPYTVEGGSFRAGKPRLWTEGKFSLRRGLRNFDLHPDSERIAVFKAAQDQVEERTDHAVLILNFFEVLRQELEGKQSE